MVSTRQYIDFLMCKELIKNRLVNLYFLSFLWKKKHIKCLYFIEIKVKITVENLMEVIENEN